MTDEQLKKNSLIFIGVSRLSLFKKKKQTILSFQRKKDQYDVSSFGMINETTARIVWTQPSVWNKEQTMTVFSGMTAI
ncbi:hypothetical protein ACEQPO_03285 [Bacillus sp. SL00103]